MGKQSTSAIILAGGIGSRFGKRRGKQIVNIGGKPMLTWSIQAFDKADDVGEIILVCPDDRIQEYWDVAVAPFPTQTPIKTASAGTIRQESAFNGLEMVGDEFDIVAIHDGARPHVSSETINHVINELKGNYEADGAVVGFQCVDTIKIIEDGIISGTPDRSCLWVAHTPQVFRKNIYKTAHFAALSDGFVGTDDSSLVERLGGKILALTGRRDNIKLTQPEDYAVLSSTIANKINELYNQIED